MASPPAGRDGPPKTRIEALYQLARRPGGVDSTEAAQRLRMTAQQASQMILNLARHRQLKVRVAELPGVRRRLFGTQAEADAWLAVNKPYVPLSKRRASGEDKRGPRKAGAGAGASKPTARAYPGVDLRYQVLPGQRVYGAGFAAAGVGIDITTGRPWGR